MRTIGGGPPGKLLTRNPHMRVALHLWHGSPLKRQSHLRTELGRAGDDFATPGQADVEQEKGDI